MHINIFVVNLSSPMKENKDTLLQKGRRRLLVGQLEAIGLFSDKVMKAIGTVPRHLFVQEGLEDMAYKDTPVAIAAGQTISQPSTVALQTQLLEIKSGSRVLEIGTGCGYQTAVLFYLGAEVYSIERQEELFHQAAKNLDRAGYFFAEKLAGENATRIDSGKIHLFLGDGFAGLEEEAPFDAIVVTCGAPEVPIELLHQLAPGGRLVIPVDIDDPKDKRKKEQILKLIVKMTDGRFKAKNISKMSFVPMLKGIEKKKK